MKVSIIKIALLTAIVGQSLLLFPQQTKIDSLLNLLKKDKADTGKVNHLYTLSLLLSNNKPDTSKKIFAEVRLLSEKLNWQQGIALSHHGMGLLCDNSGDFSNALREYARALLIWNKLISSAATEKESTFFKTRKLKTLSAMGADYNIQGNFPKALDASFEGLKIATGINSKKHIASNNGTIGSVFNNQKQYDKALQYYGEALKNYTELDSKAGRGYCYIGIGNIYNDKGEFDKALESYFKALKINEETGNAYYTGATLGNIGNVYVRNNQPEKALEFYLKALETDKKANNKSGIAYCLSSLGTLYYKQRKYKEAKEYLTEGLELAENNGSLQLQKDNHLALSDLFAEQSDFKRSLEHHRKYMIMKDSLFNEEKNKEITRHELNYEFEKKEAETKAEQDKKEAVALADKKRQMIFFWLISSVAIAVGIIALIVYKSLKVARKQKLIIEHQKGLVEEKQKEVLDSIRYAKRIQQSLLPRESYIDKNLNRMRR